jgi:hypothetical protein
MTAAQTIAIQPLATASAGYSQKRLWLGRILSGLSGVFLIFDGVMKLMKTPFAVQATVQVGYPESTIVGIGAVLVLSTVVYLIPRTSIVGAVLLTGYLGGAVATNVRAQTGIFNPMFPVVFASLVWGGLWLRDRRGAQLLPLISKGHLNHDNV